ncbi:MAG: 3-oxoadipyl-CoA thiolase [Gammaproteobacteria bacterium]|nr:3-oxoadipyl-CoA thiolase [Gammaproteobacteria bacterium]
MRVRKVHDVYICDGVRTPIGRYGGALSSIRTDDLGSVPIRKLMERNHQVDWSLLDDLILGCANQAGEDSRNVGRMCSLLAGLPVTVPASTVNRLCGSGMDAVGIATRSIRCGETKMWIAGGVESMSRAPFVMPKAFMAFSRDHAVYDTTIGWRFINSLMQKQYGVDSMPETAENVALECNISREDQDRFAVWSQTKTAIAIQRGFYEQEIVPVSIPQRRGGSKWVKQDEHPRQTTMASLSKLGPLVSVDGTVTAGNSTGINDGACALLLANEEAVRAHSLIPRARILCMTTTGIEPRIMGLGPISASRKALNSAGLTLDQMDVIEINEAFAAQVLAVLRSLGIADDDPRVNPNGGAIALGHPLGASGTRLLVTAMNQLEVSASRYALCTMCVGVGQGIAMVIERLSRHP